MDARPGCTVVIPFEQSLTYGLMYKSFTPAREGLRLSILKKNEHYTKNFSNSSPTYHWWMRWRGFQ